MMFCNEHDLGITDENIQGKRYGDLLGWIVEKATSGVPYLRKSGYPFAVLTYQGYVSLTKFTPTK